MEVHLFPPHRRGHRLAHRAGPRTRPARSSTGIGSPTPGSSERHAGRSWPRRTICAAVRDDSEVTAPPQPGSSRSRIGLDGEASVRASCRSPLSLAVKRSGERRTATAPATAAAATPPAARVRAQRVPTPRDACRRTPRTAPAPSARAAETLGMPPRPPRPAGAAGCAPGVGRKCPNDGAARIENLERDRPGRRRSSGSSRSTRRSPDWAPAARPSAAAFRCRRPAMTLIASAGLNR